MKNLLKPANLPILTLGAGAVGLLLRLWLLGSVDEAGFVAANHPADFLLWILTAAVLAVLFIGTRPLLQANKYQFNFPAQLPGAVGCFLAALGMVIVSLGVLLGNPDSMDIFTAVLGILSACALAFLGQCRLRGLHPNCLFHVVIAVYFMAWLISQYRHWSADPQMQDYCFQLIAGVCLMLAVYHRACFDANFGKRSDYAFFSLAAVYFSLLSMHGWENTVFFLSTAAWMLTNLCSLIPMPNASFRNPLRKRL